MSRRAPAVAIAALLGVACTGCSSAPSGAGNGGARAKAVRFSQCMRSHGVRGFPDPDASGALTIDGVLNGSSLNPNSAPWKRAVSACKDLEPPGFTGPRRTPAEQQNALELARCIRANGVTDFPDPAPGEPPVDTNRIPSSRTPQGMSILNAAMHTCGGLLVSKGAGR